MRVPINELGLSIFYNRYLNEASMNISDRHSKLLKRTFLDYQSTAEFMSNPLIVSRAEGLYYWDVDGKRYFDGISGIYSTLLGHRHPRLHLHQ